MGREGLSKLSLTVRVLIGILLTLFAAAPAGAFQDTFRARVTRVTDGNTIEALKDGHQLVTVRLYGVDAPERNQDFGLKATQLTSSLLFGRDIEVVQIGPPDRSGVVSGIVGVNGVAVNARLVVLGLAWVNPEQCTRMECREWGKLQEKAMKSEKGLWSQVFPIPPWEFRKIVPRDAKLPTPIDQTKIAKIDIKCKKCGKVHKHHIKFTADSRTDEIAKKDGYLPFPPEDVITCSCGTMIDLSGPKKELQSATGRRNIE
jgi:endonuclease YncB( thermonuclease family)